MSVFADFARRELADKYNQTVFSLVNYLSIRVSMTIKQSKCCVRSLSFRTWRF